MLEEIQVMIGKLSQVQCMGESFWPIHTVMDLTQFTRVSGL